MFNNLGARTDLYPDSVPEMFFFSFKKSSENKTHRIYPICKELDRYHLKKYEI